MKFKQILTLTIALATVSAVMISCNFGAYPGYKKTESGIYYKIYTNDFAGAAKLRADLMEAKTFEDVYHLVNSELV